MSVFRSPTAMAEEYFMYKYFHRFSGSKIPFLWLPEERAACGHKLLYFDTDYDVTLFRFTKTRGTSNFPFIYIEIWKMLFSNDVCTFNGRINFPLYESFYWMNLSIWNQSLKSRDSPMLHVRSIIGKSCICIYIYMFIYTSF